METLVLSLGFYYLTIQNIAGLFVVLFLMGLQSTLFGPSKFGILPEILDEDQLSRGNGYTQFWTFLAIIFGTAAGGYLSALSENKCSSLGRLNSPAVLFLKKGFQFIRDCAQRLRSNRRPCEQTRDFHFHQVA